MWNQCFLKDDNESSPFELVLQSSKSCVRIFSVDDGMMRVLVLLDRSSTEDGTWFISPGDSNRDTSIRRISLAAELGGVPFQRLCEDADSFLVETRLLRATVSKKGAFFQWEQRPSVADAFVVMARDRKTQHVLRDERGIRHYQELRDSDRFYGLGEVAGPLNHAGQRIRLSPTDAMGYDAMSSQPLYKNIPFLICSPEVGGTFGLYYDAPCDVVFDLGCERSNYHGRYRYVELEDPELLDFYVIAGPRVLDVSRRFTWLTGRPTVPPSYSFGYSGSSMARSDAADAQERLSEFLACLREHRIPCTSFHLSSGYTSRGNRRYVFTLNTTKFPQWGKFLRDFEEAGCLIIPNIKPCLLDDHPMYEECKQLGLFVPGSVQFWSGVGSLLDFTSPATRKWWGDHVTKLLDSGCAATWNDNNEFEGIVDVLAVCSNGKAAKRQRSLLTHLMIRASWDAQRNSGRPVFLVTRSGFPGMQRFCQTWSGDNTTSWKTLRGNLRMGLGLSLSGVSNLGHDVGGFAGPQPGPELLVRWVEAVLLHPRFSIHSWKEDGSITEPWMFPGKTTHIIARLLRLRSALIPLLFHFFVQHAASLEPLLRPRFVVGDCDAHEEDESDDWFLGSSVLVTPVLDPGVTERVVRLPSLLSPSWWLLDGGLEFDASSMHTTIPAPLGTVLAFVKPGTILPFDASLFVGHPCRGVLAVPFATRAEFCAHVEEAEGMLTVSLDWLGASECVAVHHNQDALCVAIPTSCHRVVVSASSDPKMSTKEVLGEVVDDFFRGFRLFLMGSLN